MKLDSLIVENFKGMKNQDIRFDGKTSILFGINGVGKSSVLEAINILFAPILNRIASNMFKQVDRLDIDDIKFGEAISTVSMACHMGDSGLDRNEYVYSRTIIKQLNRRSHNKTELYNIAEDFIRNYLDGNTLYLDLKTNMPIYANYGAHRAVHIVKIERIRNKHTFDKISAFQNAIENVIDFRMFFEWFRNQQEYENYIKVEKNQDYVDLQLNCVKKAIITMLGKEIFTDIKIMLQPLRMVAKKYGENLKIEQLSDGEKCTLAMIGDLARRLAIANPSLENPLEGEGIVLIDEVELHLHPTWQARIVPTLIDIFPNIQFIITTHSPKVLGEISGDLNIFRMDNIENEITVNRISSLASWDVNTILNEYMGTNPLKLDSKCKIDRIFVLIEEEKFEEASAMTDKLEEETSNLNPEVVKARILIRRGQIKK